jgi:dolichol-phosphate mannosyltransferase
MTLRAIREGASVTEVPIEFVERAQGVSKMSGSIVREAFLKVFVWGLARPFRRGVIKKSRPGARE